MAERKKAKTLNRRAFLTAAGVGAGAIGAATIAVKPAQAAITEKASEGDGYRRTSHVKKYYELTRF